jgi:hypothetical protein
MPGRLCAGGGFEKNDAGARTVSIYHERSFAYETYTGAAVALELHLDRTVLVTGLEADLELGLTDSSLRDWGLRPLRREDVLIVAGLYACRYQIVLGCGRA